MPEKKCDYCGEAPGAQHRPFTDWSVWDGLWTRSCASSFIKRVFVYEGIWNQNGTSKVLRNTIWAKTAFRGCPRFLQHAIVTRCHIPTWLHFYVGSLWKPSDHFTACENCIFPPPAASQWLPDRSVGTMGLWAGCRPRTSEYNPIQSNPIQPQAARVGPACLPAATAACRRCCLPPAACRRRQKVLLLPPGPSRAQDRDIYVCSRRGARCGVWCGPERT